MNAPRSAAAIASLVILCGSIACTNFYEIPIETPIQPKLDVSPFNRVLIAGFISGGTDDVDANLETVRLLRSQLRSKSNLRVIEAEVLPLAEIARDQSQKRADSPLPAVAEVPATPVTAEAAAQTPAPATPESELKIRNEKDLERFQGIFADTEFWKKLGEEYQSPLIVTGTVLFTNRQTAGFVNRQVESVDSLGRRIITPVRMYMERKGYAIDPNFIFIDGRTGAILYSEKFHEERLYPAQQNVPALSSYFELMDQLVPSFLGALSTQKIRGTRFLLK
jgi:hypothetical protein